MDHFLIGFIISPTREDSILFANNLSQECVAKAFLHKRLRLYIAKLVLTCDAPILYRSKACKVSNSLVGFIL